MNVSNFLEIHQPQQDRCSPIHSFFADCLPGGSTPKDMPFMTLRGSMSSTLLEKEHARLKRVVVVDLALEKQVLRSVAKRNF